jgi:muconolactone delta-isomerase
MSRRCSGVADAALAPHAAAEALQAFRLMRSGTFERLWFSPDYKGAVLIVDAASREEAEAALATLPMVAANAIAFDVWRLDPYDHYARLFKDEHREAL